MHERHPESAHISSGTPGDGTRQILQWGGSMFGAGILAAILLLTVFGGFTPTGATTNSGWLALIVALMCIPFGGLMFALGIAKWFRKRSPASAQK